MKSISGQHNSGSTSLSSAEFGSFTHRSKCFLALCLCHKSTKACPDAVKRVAGSVKRATGGGRRAAAPFQDQEQNWDVCRLTKEDCIFCTILGRLTNEAHSFCGLSSFSCTFRNILLTAGQASNILSRVRVVHCSSQPFARSPPKSCSPFPASLFLIREIIARSHRCCGTRSNVSGRAATS